MTRGRQQCRTPRAWGLAPWHPLTRSRYSAGPGSDTITIEPRRAIMGLLINGVWHDQWYDTSGTGGRFVRAESQFRNWITPDGAPGPSGEGGFKAESGRYHLYVSLACPWANRTLIFRAIKGLQDMIGLSVTHWLM